MPISSEFLTSNVYVAFPFKEDAIGIVYPPNVYQHGDTATIPANLIVDALISVPDNINVVVLYSIERIDISVWRLRFADLTGTVILTYDLTSLPTFTLNQFGIIKLQNEPLRYYMSFVVTTFFNTYLEEIDVGTTDFFGITLPFENSVINILPPRLTAITINDSLTEYTGKLKLIAGYNVEIFMSTDINDITSLTLNIAPGIGEGLAPCEEISVPKLMSLIPDSDGNIELQDENGCYNIIPHQLTKTIEIQGDCYQCCNCSQYVNVGLAIKKIIDRAMISKTDLMAFQVKLNDEISKYNVKLDSCTTLANFYASGRKYPDNKSGLIAVGFVNSSSKYDLTVNSVNITTPVPVTHVSPPGDSVPFVVPKGQTNVALYSLEAPSPIPGTWTVTVLISYTINTKTRSWTKTFTLLET